MLNKRINRSLPAWLRHSIKEVFQGHLCKHIPTSLSFALDTDDRRELVNAGASQTAKRQRVDEVAKFRYEPDLMAEYVWSRLSVSRFSLPHHLRPGKHAR